MSELTGWVEIIIIMVATTVVWIWIMDRWG